MTHADIKELAGLPSVDTIEVRPDGTVVVKVRPQTAQDYTAPPAPFIPAWNPFVDRYGHGQYTFGD